MPFVLRIAATGVALAVLFAGSTWAAEVRIACWNVHEGFTPQGIAERRAELQACGDALRPDVIVLEEVVSTAVATAVRDALGLHGYYVACSNFNPSDDPDFSALEVAILSRYPPAQVVEYDPTPDNDLFYGDPDEAPLTADYKLGIPAPGDVSTIRGFLWARIPDLRLTVVGVHLKSSRGVDGDVDRDNAARREFVVAAVARSVAYDAALFPDHSPIVAGDFNVGHSDPKNGRDLRRDDLTSSDSTDGYDETHALLLGLAGVKMTNLMREISDTTFPSFPSTPIDNIYVGGPNVARFTPAEMLNDTFGSDHRPIVTTMSLDESPAAPAAAPADYRVPTLLPRPSEPKLARPPKPEASTRAVSVALADVADHVGEKCVVEFEVRSGNKLETGRLAFLNSKDDYRDAGNFTTVVNSDALAKFATAGIDDPSVHFRGRKVRVTGVVALRSGAHQIMVNEPSQIEILP